MDVEIKMLKPGFSYDSCICYDHGSNTIYEFTNVIKGNPTPKSESYFEGTYFLLAPVGHYFHFLKEYIAPFLYYKKHINDKTRYIWAHTDWPLPDFHQMKRVNEETYETLINQYPDHEEISLDLIDKEGDIYIEKLIFMFDSGQIITNKSFPNIEQARNGCNKELREFFAEFMLDDPAKPKKIFISRRKVSEYLKSTDDLGSISRYNPEWLEDATEDYFKNNGYEIIDLSGMSVSEQVSYFYNATHVAGAMGAGLVNGIFSKPDTKFICLRIHEWFLYPYDEDIQQVIDAPYLLFEVYSMKDYDSTIKHLDKIDRFYLD